MAQKPKPAALAAPMPAITPESVVTDDKETPDGQMRVYVLRATWIGTERQDIGTALDLPLADAIAGIENGHLSRNPVEG